MKVLALYGSPHQQGISSRAHDIFLAPLAEAGAVVTKLNAYDLRVLPCIDCGVCAKEPRCIYDDMSDVYSLFNDVEAITISSPVYFTSLPGPLKNIIDRCQLIWEEKRRNPDRGKALAGYFIATAGSNYRNIFDPSITVVRHLFNTLGCVYDEKDFFLLPGVDNNSEGPEQNYDVLFRRGREFLSLINNRILPS